MAIRRYNVLLHQDSSTRYASDLNDQEFELIAPHVAQKNGSGKKRTVNIHEVLNAIFYRTRTGCQWRMLPSDFPAWYHVWMYVSWGMTRDEGQEGCEISLLEEFIALMRRSAIAASLE